MGLDMFITKKTYIMERDRPRIEVTGVKGVIGKYVTTIEEEVAVWRKANAIHQWFVENVQHEEDDCNDHRFTHEKMEELLETVNDVLKDHNKAEELLPTQGGFFFGSIVYDDYYYEDLKYTKEALEEILKNYSKESSYYYCSSW